jgi:hypothetical protein
MDTFSIQEAAEKAKQTKRNIFTIGETLTMDHFQLFMNIIKSNNFSRARFCFISCTIVDLTVEMIKKLVDSGTTIDAMLFYNVKCYNLQNLFSLIGSLKDITVLSFSKCSLKECPSSFLIDALKKLEYIRTFSVSNERCDPSFFNEVCNVLANKKYIENFQWKDTNLGDPNTFASFFRSAPEMKIVDISQASLNDEWRSQLNDLLDENWKLEELIVSDFCESLRSKIKRNKSRAQQMKKMPSFGLHSLIQDMFPN